ncbi:hypothetical protein [Anaerophaga thermohalophila]|uniref:hypothetical protein n=1 Tax=Anaerophaga thermohalophila TaxID=177400 RepID=UPI0012DC80CE|nr:hypothetical protein [Anaerophaga thermohalophila]
MRILFICSAKVWGGNEKWVSLAMQGLKKRHQVLRDTSEVAKRLKQIISLPDDRLSSIGEKGANTVRRLFNMDTMVKELESFLHNFV